MACDKCGNIPEGIITQGWSTANMFKPPSDFIAGRPKVALLVLLAVLFAFFFQACLIAVVSVLYVIVALWPPALQYQLPALLFVCVL